MVIDSSTTGDATRFRSFEDLRSALDALARPPLTDGRLLLIVRRAEGGRRELLDRVRVSPEEGLPGDAWERTLPRAIESQITMMQHAVAELVANGQPLALSGDNLIVDLDLSEENLPPGARLRIGSALLEVTEKPHNGCAKFAARFGHDALRFVSLPETRHRNLRGIHVRVVEAGEMKLGASIDVHASKGHP